MNAFELFRTDKPDQPVAPTGVWACGKCGILHGKAYGADPQAAAEQCCRPRVCETCGTEIKTSTCSDCWHQKQAVLEAEKLATAEKLGPEYDGPVYWGDRYWGTVGDFLDEYEDDENLVVPEYIWACRLVPYSPIDYPNETRRKPLGFSPCGVSLENTHEIYRGQEITSC